MTIGKLDIQKSLLRFSTSEIVEKQHKFFSYLNVHSNSTTAPTSAQLLANFRQKITRANLNAKKIETSPQKIRISR